MDRPSHLMRFLRSGGSAASRPPPPCHERGRAPEGLWTGRHVPAAGWLDTPGLSDLSRGISAGERQPGLGAAGRAAPKQFARDAEQATIPGDLFCRAASNHNSE